MKPINLFTSAFVFLVLMLTPSRIQAQPMFDPCNFVAGIPGNWKQAVPNPSDNDAWPSYIPGVHAASNLLIDAPNKKVFFVGTDGFVYNYYWDNALEWEIQPLTASQYVGIDASGGLYKDQWGRIFAIGVDGKAYNFYWQNNAWQFHALVSTQYALLNPVGGLLVNSQGNQVFAIGIDGRVYNYYWAGSAWAFNWLNPNQYATIDARGKLAMAPDGKIFAIGTDGKVYNYYWTGSSWAFNWLNQNQYTTIDPRGGMLLEGDGKVYAIGTDGKVYNYYWTGSSWAFNWLNQNQYAAIDPRGKLAMGSDGKIFAIGTDGKVYNYYWTGSSWAFNWLDPNQYATIDPLAGLQLAGDGQVFAMGTDGKMYNYYWYNNAWQFQRLYMNQAATVRASNQFALDGQVYTVLNNGQISVFYYADSPLDYCDWNLVTSYDFGTGTTVATVANDWNMNGYPWGHTNNLGFQWEYNDASAFSMTSTCLRITANNAPVYGNVADYLPANQIMSDNLPNYRQFAFTSGIMYSKASYLYGLFEIRCKQPPGRGFWPAFWMLGANAEMDIFEGLGAYPNYSSNNNIWNLNPTTTDHCGMAYNTSASPSYTSDFHTFSLAWFSDHITFYVDGAELRTVYHHIPQVPMYMLANLAVGIEYPNASTPFPSYYDIDYIRVYSYGPHCREAASEEPENTIEAPAMTFQVYPSPASDIVNICAAGETKFIDKVEVYNLAGEKVQEQEGAQNTNVQLNVATLPAGTYVVRIYAGQTVQSQKFVRQ